MSAIHLYMMELKRHRERCLQPSFAVFSPHHHGIAKLFGILIDYTIQLSFNHCRCADDHAILQKRTFALFGYFLRQALIIIGKLLQVTTKRDVTRIDGAAHVLYNDIDGKPVKLIHLSIFGQHVELINCACCLAYAPTH